MARTLDSEVAAVEATAGPVFREELHAIDVVLAGQGVGIASDVSWTPKMRQVAKVEPCP
jgi:hypothetical protein